MRAFTETKAPGRSRQLHERRPTELPKLMAHRLCLVRTESPPAMEMGQISHERTAFVFENTLESACCRDQKTTPYIRVDGQHHSDMFFF